MPIEHWSSIAIRVGSESLIWRGLKTEQRTRPCFQSHFRSICENSESGGLEQTGEGIRVELESAGERAGQSDVASRLA